MAEPESRKRGEAIHSLRLAADTEARAADPEVIVMIDSRRLERECFIRSMELIHPELTVLGYPSADAFSDGAASLPFASIILLNLGDHHPSEPAVKDDMAKLLNCAESAPIVVVAPSEALDQMIAALDAGASGYVPSNLGLDVFIESAKLAALGGVVIRMDSLANLRKSFSKDHEMIPRFESFTDRQTAVAEALRQGKPNKVIAHELDMCESTVKVHIRNIMSKLKSSNRTEAAFKLNSILPPHEH